MDKSITNVVSVVSTKSPTEKANMPAVVSTKSQPEKVKVPAVVSTKMPTETVKTPALVSINSEEKGIEDVFLALKIERDTFKLTVKNDRSTHAMGDFLVDVYDMKGRLLFNDARMMRVEANSSVQFYRYDLKTMMQGQRLSDVVIVTTWKDAFNKMREMKNTFHIDPTTMNATNDVLKTELNK